MENNQFSNPFENSGNPFAAADQPPAEPSRVAPPVPPKQQPEPKKSLWPSKSRDDASSSAVVDIEAREQALARRERDVQEREQRVTQRENDVGKSANTKNNYPPCAPVVYSNIRQDVPPNGQNLCRIGFLYMHMHIAAMLLNWFCVFADFSLKCFFISLIYVLVGVWVAWNLQYRRLYKALTSQSDSRVFFFLFNFFFSLGFDVVMAIGVPETCGVGLWTALDQFSHKHKATGLMFFVSFILWTLNGLLALYIFKATLSLWKQMGGSVQKVKSEARKEGVKAALNSYS